MALRELLVSFGIEVSGKEELKSIDGTLTGIVDRAKQVASAMGALALVKGITSFVTDTVEMGAHLYDIANRLGIGTDELQQFDYAAKTVGMSTDQAARSLQFLERHLGLAESGSKTAAKDFQQLGVHLKGADGKMKPFGELLPEIADGFEKLKDDPERVAYAVKLFGRAGAGIVPVLRQGKNGLRALYTEFQALGGGLKSDFIEKAKEADRAMTRLGVAFAMMKSRAVLPLIPALEAGMVLFQKFFGYLGHLSDITYGAQTALMALGTVAAVALAPLLLSTLAIIGPWLLLYGVFDDLFTLFQGGDSVIGRFIDLLFGQGAHTTFVKDVKEEFQKFLAWCENTLIPFFKDLGHALKWAIDEAGLPAIRMYGDAWRAVWEILKGVVDALEKIAELNPSGAWHAMGVAGDKAKDIIRGGKSEEVLNYEAKMRAWQEGLNAQHYGPTYSPDTASYAPVAPAASSNSSVDNTRSSSVSNVDNTKTSSMQSEVNVNVVVQGGMTNSETGSIVGNAAGDAAANALRNAHAAAQTRGQ